jgi:arylsulfatase
METVDEEFLAAAKDFIDRNHKANKPFFVWFNSTRMHIFTHLKPGSKGKTGLGIQADGMVEHDGHVGELLKQLDDLKIADNTIVIYTTDNGAMKSMWPDGGARDYVTPDDVRAVVYDCLRHRLILSYEANAEGLTTDDVLKEIVQRVAVA